MRYRLVSNPQTKFLKMNKEIQSMGGKAIKGRKPWNKGIGKRRSKRRMSESLEEMTERDHAMQKSDREKEINAGLFGRPPEKSHCGSCGNFYTPDEFSRGEYCQACEPGRSSLRS